MTPKLPLPKSPEQKKAERTLTICCFGLALNDAIIAALLWNKPMPFKFFAGTSIVLGVLWTMIGSVFASRLKEAEKPDDESDESKK